MSYVRGLRMNLEHIDEDNFYINNSKTRHLVQKKD